MDDIEALGHAARVFERQGYLTRNSGRLELTPKAVRTLGDNALRRILADMRFGRRSGDHDQQDVGQARAHRRHPALGIRGRAAP